MLPHENRLYHLDLEEQAEAEIALVTTIHDDDKVYTKKQVERAIKAQQLQTLLGYSLKKDFDSMVGDNLIANCPVIPENVSHAHKLFGENVASLRGKTIHQKLE